MVVMWKYIVSGHTNDVELEMTVRIKGGPVGYNHSIPGLRAGCLVVTVNIIPIKKR